MVPEPHPGCSDKRKDLYARHKINLCIAGPLRHLRSNVSEYGQGLSEGQGVTGPRVSGMLLISALHPYIDRLRATVRFDLLWLDH